MKDERMYQQFYQTKKKVSKRMCTKQSNNFARSLSFAVLKAVRLMEKSVLDKHKWSYVNLSFNLSSKHAALEYIASYVKRCAQKRIKVTTDLFGTVACF